MENLISRNDFCDKISKCIINLLNQRFCVNEVSEKCLIQRTRHRGLKKIGDLHMSKTLVKYLELKYGAKSNENRCINLELRESLDQLVTKSQGWNLPLAFYKEHDGGFVFGLSKFQAFSYIIPKVFNTDISRTSQLGEDAIVLCHVNTNPALHDLRTLIYCEVLCNLFNGGCKVVLSKDEHCGKCFLYEDLIRDLHLKMDLVAPTHIEAYTLNNHILPTHFADCLGDHKSSYPNLERLHHHGNRTAFASKITNGYKNSIVHKCKEFMSQKRKGAFRCVHVCDQTKFLMAQQSELFHAWYKDDELDSLKDPDSMNCDQFFTHSSVKSTPTVSTTEFLDKRTNQIKESFESKLQITANGNQWKRVFDKMRAALIKLELLKNSSTSLVKLEDSLPSDAVFVLYNYSRLHMLIEKYSDKVSKGEYPSIPLDDIDFKCLQEEAEWELVIDHLWTLHDAIRMVDPILKEHSLHINSHHLIGYLHHLCHCFSTYYSRYHILVEPLPHLIPMMTARICLMRAVKKALDHIFELLGIDPVLQM